VEWAKYLGVALAAIFPWGEELVAIPLGIGLGLPPIWVVAVALPCNYIPALLISALFKIGERHPTLIRWLHKLRGERIKRLLNRWGLLGVVLIAPWAGVYATVATMEVLGMGRRRLHLAIIWSLVLYALVFATAAHFGMSLLRSG